MLFNAPANLINTCACFDVDEKRRMEYSRISSTKTYEAQHTIYTMCVQTLKGSFSNTKLPHRTLSKTFFSFSLYNNIPPPLLFCIVRGTYIRGEDKRRSSVFSCSQSSLCIWVSQRGVQSIKQLNSKYSSIRRMCNVDKLYAHIRLLASAG